MKVNVIGLAMVISRTIFTANLMAITLTVFEINIQTIIIFMILTCGDHD